MSEEDREAFDRDLFDEESRGDPDQVAQSVVEEEMSLFSALTRQNG